MRLLKISILSTIKIIFSKVGANEKVSRFVYSKKHYRKSDNTASWQAFKPNRNNETSVFRIDGLFDSKIWNLNLRKNKKVYGRADLHAKSITDCGLYFEADIIPLRHANIVGWEESHIAMRKAQELFSKGIPMIYKEET